MLKVNKLAKLFNSLVVGENKSMIYFDNASTTKPFDCVIDEIASFNKQHFFNPSALYKEGIETSKIIEKSRQVIADNLGVESEEIYFTSSATEANNWTLLNGFKKKKGNVVISLGEHASVFECGKLLHNRGIEVRWIKLKNDGTIDLEDLEIKVDENTVLVSIIHVSNETGAINDIETIGKLIKNKNPAARLHSDGAAAFCKIGVLQHVISDRASKSDDFRGVLPRRALDFYTISGHKIGGPKGVGVLYINKKLNIAPLIVGGGQERGMRSGTENTGAIVGFAKAAACHCEQSNIIVRQIHDFIKNELMHAGWIYNGSQNNTGYILSLSNPKIKAEILMRLLSEEGILIGLGSACANKLSQNRVLSAAGAAKTQIEGSIRLSFSPQNTMAEAKIVVQKIIEKQQFLQGKISK